MNILPVIVGTKLRLLRFGGYVIGHRWCHLVICLLWAWAFGWGLGVMFAIGYLAGILFGHFVCPR